MKKKINLREAERLQSSRVKSKQKGLMTAQLYGRFPQALFLKIKLNRSD